MRGIHYRSSSVGIMSASRRRRIGYRPPASPYQFPAFTNCATGVTATTKPRQWRDRTPMPVAAAPAPELVSPPLAQPVSPPVAPPASRAAIEPVASARPPTLDLPLPHRKKWPRRRSRSFRRRAPPVPPIATPATPPAVKPADAAPPAPDAAPKLLKISHDVDHEPVETPLGDWQTEGKTGSVRIERCGRALCGYVLDPSSKAAGETLLINMTPKAASEWSGNIYSRDSGNTYYATVAMKGPNSFRVEACALGRFFCSGNLWSRIGAGREKLMTSRQVSPEPRS